MRDRVDDILDEWARNKPDVDARPMGVVGRISRASRLAEREVNRYYAEHGLQSWEFDVLASLLRIGPPHRLGAGELGRAVMISSAALTNRVDRMVARGLVDRAVDDTNRRAVVISLTTQGLATVNAVAEGHYANEARILSALTERDQQALARLLRKLLVGLGDVSQSDRSSSAP